MRDEPRENLELTSGVIFAEAAMIALAKHLGRSEAHELLEEASKQAAAEKKHLRDVLTEHPKVRSHLRAEEIDDLFEALSYTGIADTLIERAIAAYRLNSKRSEVH